MFICEISINILNMPKIRVDRARTTKNKIAFVLQPRCLLKQEILNHLISKISNKPKKILKRV